MDKAEFDKTEITVKGIFDTHCHYDDPAFDPDRDAILEGLMSADSPVSYLMHASTDLRSSRFGIDTASRYDRFYTSVGIHPEVLDDPLPEGWLAELKKLALSSEKVKAIGEIGLDYHYEGYDRGLQISVFEAQLELAAELSLPVIMHCRDATEDFVSLMQKHRPRGVCHCFSGSAETALQLLPLGLYFGFGGALTFKNNKKAKRAFSAIPLDKLLFETDCPYMAPPPYRGKRCQSELISYVAAEAAALSGRLAQELVDVTALNAKTLFEIK